MKNGHIGKGNGWENIPIPWSICCFLFPRDPVVFSDDEQRVSNHLRNARYLASITFSEGDWIPRVWLALNAQNEQSFEDYNITGKQSPR